jgi:undecaprenyl-diphosphatase
MYGFVSSHAANSFAVATLISFIMRQRLVTFSLFTWAVLQCYSRMYLGVHYPGDILGGIIVGLLAGWLVWRLMRWIEHRWRINEGNYTRSDANVLSISLVITITALLIAALIPLL